MNGYLKPALVTIAAAVERMMLPLDPNYEKENIEKNARRHLFIHDMQIPDPFVIKTRNDFIDSPPFGLYDIFNHLIYHATKYDKQGLAAYKSYEDYRLFEDGYVESSLLVHFTQQNGDYIYSGLSCIQNRRLDDMI